MIAACSIVLPSMAYRWLCMMRLMGRWLPVGLVRGLSVV